MKCMARGPRWLTTVFGLRSGKRCRNRGKYLVGPDWLCWGHAEEARAATERKSA